MLRRTWVLSLLLTPAGCGGVQTSADDGVPSESTGVSTTAVDELAAHDGRPCPRRLPDPDEPGYGFGTDEPAATAPLLPAFARAWVCRFSPQSTGPDAATGVRFGWRGEGPAYAVTGADLRTLRFGRARTTSACAI